MLSNVITYMLPDDSQIGMILVGGEGSLELPFSLSDDSSASSIVNYLENTMSSLGGEYYTKEAMEGATTMLANEGTNDNQMIFHVTHGPPVDSSQSPCPLHETWGANGIRIITIMDGDIG